MSPETKTKQIIIGILGKLFDLHIVQNKNMFFFETNCLFYLKSNPHEEVDVRYNQGSNYTVALGGALFSSAHHDFPSHMYAHT